MGQSCAMNGLEISSSPSTGLSSVIVGPRSTARPSMRMRGSGSGVTDKIRVRRVEVNRGEQSPKYLP